MSNLEIKNTEEYRDLFPINLNLKYTISAPTTLFIIAIQKQNPYSVLNIINKKNCLTNILLSNAKSMLISDSDAVTLTH